MARKKLAVDTRTTSRRRARWWDAVVMHDLGLVKLQGGLRVLLCLPAGMAIGYFIALTVGLPGSVGLVVGALPVFLTCFIIVDDKASRVAARSGAAFFPFVISLFCSLALHQFRTLELALMVLLLFAQFYAPKFGVWAGDAAAMFFGAYLCGLLLPLPLASFDGLLMICAGSLIGTIVVRTVFFRPNSYRSLLQTRRAFVAWSLYVLVASVAVLEAEGDAHAEIARLRRRLSQLRGAALVADGLLASPGDGPKGESAELLHRLLFDIELVIAGLARVCHSLVTLNTREEVRMHTAEAMRMVRDRGGRTGREAAKALSDWWTADCAKTDPASMTLERKTEAHNVRRMISLLIDLQGTSDQWQAMKNSIPTTDGVPFQSPVALFGGRVVGAIPVLGDTLADGGMSGPWRRLRISAPLRTGIQAAIAVAIVEPIALLLGGDRFYWGIIGVMVILGGTNSTHERVRKAINRGIGTVVGGVLGILLVNELGTGHIWWSLSLIVVVLAVGFYSFMSSYWVWTACLVIALCQVYAFAPGFTDALLPLRLVENMAGAAVALLVSTFILPVATRSIVRQAIRLNLEAIRDLVSNVCTYSSTPDDLPRLRANVRAIDQASFRLEAVMKPVWRFGSNRGFRRDDDTRTILIAAGSYCRELAVEIESLGRSDAASILQLQAITGELTNSINSLVSAVDGNRSAHEWHTISSALDDAGLSAKLHSLGRIDDCLAALADRYGLTRDRPPSLADTSSIGTIRTL